MLACFENVTVKSIIGMEPGHFAAYFVRVGKDEVGAISTT